MEENKRPVATKTAIAKYRATSNYHTDEYLCALVESNYPKKYEDNLEVVNDIIKGLFRRQQDLTDDNFVSLLHEMTESGKYRKYETEIREIKRNYKKCDILFEKIYNEAKTRSFLLSECPDCDNQLKSFIQKMYGREEYNIAQTFYNVLNIKAKQEVNPNGYDDLYLSFHCYPEQNDDVLFTKEDKGLHDYDESGRADEMKRFRQLSKSRILLDKIYKEAQVHTIFLSQCAEYQDEEVKQYFEELSNQKGRTLAKQLFYQLNQMALDEAGELSGFILPFHCYSEPNGDVVFTKNRRTREDYDGVGHSIVSEEEVVNRTSLEGNDSSKKGGCLGIIVIGIILSSLIAFI